MLRRTTLAALFVAVLALPVVATAGPGGKPTFHDRETNEFTDDDFCGTGQTVTVVEEVVFSVWVGETGGDPEQDLKILFNAIATITNPDNGASVVDHSAGQFTNEIVIGLESGPHTHEFVETGLRAKLKLANGGVLTRDAGNLVYRLTFDAADNITDFEIVSVSGPHPAFGSDVWCEAAIEALGL